MPDSPISGDFARVVEEGVVLQEQLPWLEMVAVGGTAAALHAGHRYSTDVDHVTPFLRGDFDVVGERLHEWEGWKTNRVNKPTLVLGERHGVELGIRQLRRAVPLESVQVHGLWIPTVAEALRIKAFLLISRKATRDYLDVAALVDLMGREASIAALEPLNLLYRPHVHGNQTPVTHFANAGQDSPLDLLKVALPDYKGIRPPYDEWAHVAATVRRISQDLLLREMEGQLPCRLNESHVDPAKQRGRSR